MIVTEGDIFSAPDEYGEERFYCVTDILSEDEYVEALFSKMEDEDYIDREVTRKRGVKHAKGQGALAGAGLGALSGISVGSGLKSGKAALIATGIGTAAGAGLGYYLGKAHKEAVERDVDHRIKKYKSASKADKEYLRRQREKELDREIQMRQARALERNANANSYAAYFK
jgi:uncharacterized protein YcfJ